jgi:hypothetical protein
MRISIYLAEVEHCREYHGGNAAQFRMTAELELFCRDCGRHVAFTPTFPFPGSVGPPSAGLGGTAHAPGSAQ